MSMDPPLPPVFCGMDDSLLLENGEDNVAYDVSRSPSTEQDTRGRPMYHTYHDSGISAGLSPTQENEPRPGLSYRTCPDSGISGFGPQSTQYGHHSSRGCCQTDEPLPRQPQQQQVFNEQMHINRHQQPYHQQPEQPQAVLHQNLVQASVHPSHGVCYGDDTNHLQTPQHYNPPLYHPPTLNLNPEHHNDRQLNFMAHVHSPPALPHQQPRLPSCLDSPGYQQHHQNDPRGFPVANEASESPHSRQDRPDRGNILTATTADLHFDNKAMAISPANIQSAHSPGANSHQYLQKASVSKSSPTKPARHSSRDDAPPDPGLSNMNGADRPDSQASQSSTTDSEDSGFRSSHCAAHHQRHHHHHSARLSKQGNPLLKPLRRTKNNKTKCKPHTPAASNTERNGATPLITLNPQNLQNNVDNSNVIENTSLVDIDLAHRQTTTIQQNSCASNNKDRLSKSSSVTPIGGVPANFHDDSPSHTHQHSPARENWPQCTIGEECREDQNINLNDISTHLSWKYLQDISSSNSASTRAPSGGFVIQPCHQAIRPGQLHQVNHDQQMEMFGFSVV